MTVSKAAMVEGGRARKEPADGAAEGGALQLGELSELLGPANRAALLSMLTKITQEF